MDYWNVAAIMSSFGLIGVVDLEYLHLILVGIDQPGMCDGERN